MKLLIAPAHAETPRYHFLPESLWYIVIADRCEASI
jgi:hypothetical protein